MSKWAQYDETAAHSDLDVVMALIHMCIVLADTLLAPVNTLMSLL